MTGLGGPGLAAVFVAAAIATWVAGIYLSRATDALDARLNLGDALGGMILLAIAGSLPELAITISATVSGSLGIAAGNLIGGIAMQTLGLVACDRVVRGERPLTFLVGSLIPVIEGLLVVLLASVMLLGTMLPATTAIGPFSPASIFIVAGWVGGVYLLNRIRRSQPWQVSMPDSRPGRRHVREPHPTATRPFAGVGTAGVIGVFVLASVVTLVAGVLLERSGSGLAQLAGVDGVVFGATVLAAASALPEISTGIAAVRLGDHQLAVGDIFGGNAFQLCLLVVADLLAGRPILPDAGVANAWLGTLGIVMTVVYAASMIVRLRARHLGFGLDSIINTAIFVVGMIGLVQVAS